MKIALVTSYFKEDVAYQENYLSVGLVELGHDVTIVTSNLEYDFVLNRKSRQKPIGISDYHGVCVHRIPALYEVKNRFIVCKGLYGELEKLKPDCIFFYDHSPALFTSIRYKKKHQCQLYVFMHSSTENSMHSLFGKPYHKILWRSLVRYTQKYYDKVMCGAPECQEFAEQIYHINHDLIRLVSLPGDASLLSNYENIRKQVRQSLNITDDDIAIYHTGKLDERKKTREVLEAFDRLEVSDIHLYIIGWIPDDLQPTIDLFCQKNSRIHYLGWKSAEELKRMLLGADLLLQPGNNSNTFIEAICCGVPLVLNDTSQGHFLTRYDNGYLLKGNSVTEIQQGLEEVLQPKCLKELKQNAILASSKFHYKEIARQTLEE